MTIQVNTDSHIKGTDNLVERFSEDLKNKFDRYAEYVSRMEVYFADENRGKAGVDDKKCTIEVRLKGKNAEAVTAFASTLDLAYNGAVAKLQNMLANRVELMQQK